MMPSLQCAFFSWMSGENERYRFGVIGVRTGKETVGMSEVTFFLRNVIFPNYHF